MATKLCNKCRAWIPLDSDSWCVGCTASEELRGEFCKPWGAPYRRIAHDLVLSVTRQIKALRTLSVGVQSQIRSEASKQGGPAAGKGAVPPGEPPSESPDRRGALQRKRTTAPKSQPKSVLRSKEETSSYEYYPTEEEEEGEPSTTAAPVHHHTPLPAGPRKGPSPDRQPPKSHKEGSRQKERRERSSRRPPPQSEPPQQPRGKRRRPHHRAGRKHQRLYRLLENPSIRVHQKPPSTLWELQETASCHRELH